MRRIGFPFILTFILIVALLGSAAAQEPGTLHLLDTTSKSDNQVDMVVSVLDKEGTPLKGLTAANFTLWVEGREVKGFSLEPVSSAKSPLSVILALDVSGSMKGAPFAAAKKAVGVFLDQLEKDDQVALLTFGSSVQLATNFTKKHVVRDALENLEANEKWTWLYQATYEALERAARGPTSRAAVVLLTDGKDEGSPRTEAEVMSRLKGAQIPIYALGFGPQAQVDYLKNIAGASGGAFLFAPSSEELSNLYTIVYDHLKNQYLLSFPFDNPGGLYTGILKLNYQGKELDAQRRFLHVRAQPAAMPPIAVPVTPPAPATAPGTGSGAGTGETWFTMQYLLIGLLILGVVSLGTVGTIFLRRRVRPGGPVPASRQADPVREMVQGKLHPVNTPSGFSGDPRTTRIISSPGQVGLRIDVPPVPIYFGLLDEANNRNLTDIIITRYDPDIQERYASESHYLILEDKTISRPNEERAGHARVFFDAETQRYKIEDLGSFSGTKLNDVALTGSTSLENGDVITLGVVILNYYDKRVFTETKY
ncbi:MAG: VWA domain-containing protein [Deltaproteobacteria bacterium]|nr:MAG: VWA domain-containing protein [Deltaproteobacteria bacterium]